MGKAMSTAAVLAVAAVTATALTPSTDALPTSGTDVARISLAREEHKASAGDETDRPSSQANGGTVRSNDAPLGEASAAASAAVGAAANEAAGAAAAAALTTTSQQVTLTSAPAGNAATCVPPLTLLHLRAAAAAAASASMAGPRDASSPVIPTSTSGLSWGGGGSGGLGESAIAANVGAPGGVIGGVGSLGERVASPVGAGLVSVPGAPSLGFVDQHQENLGDMGVDKPVIDPEVRQKKVRRPSCLDRVLILQSRSCRAHPSFIFVFVCAPCCPIPLAALLNLLSRWHFSASECERQGQRRRLLKEAIIARTLRFALSPFPSGRSVSSKQEERAMLCRTRLA